MEPAPQGFEENEKARETFGRNCHTARGTCVVMVALVDTTYETTNTLKVRPGEGDIREEGS